MTVQALPRVELSPELTGGDFEAALAPKVRPATSGPRTLVASSGAIPAALARAAADQEIDALVLIAPDDIGTPPDGLPEDVFALVGSRDPERLARLAALHRALPEAMIALVHGAVFDPASERPAIAARAIADFAGRRQACVVSRYDARVESAPFLQEPNS